MRGAPEGFAYTDALRSDALRRHASPCVDLRPRSVRNCIPSHRLDVNVMLNNMTFLMIFCGFRSVAVNTVDKLQFLVLLFAVLLSKFCNVSLCSYKVY